MSQHITTILQRHLIVLVEWGIVIGGGFTPEQGPERSNDENDNQQQEYQGEHHQMSSTRESIQSSLTKLRVIRTEG